MGGFYVKKDGNLIREVLGSFDGKYQWLSYSTHEGSSWGDSGFIEPSGLAQWAEREATSEEIASLDRETAHKSLQQRNKEYIQGFVDNVLPLVSDHDLWREVKRRGLDKMNNDLGYEES